ncbi:MAG: hypothetical protein SVV03_06390 [Candidatus Nanohaloarchaea archaeon]|nr:hypothetical protein [Candidatus Nanohaloarchaea archaeon]
MAGICESCNDVSETLVSCELCGAKVCTDCKKESGCRVCGGVRKVEGGRDVEGMR